MSRTIGWVASALAALSVLTFYPIIERTRDYLLPVSRVAVAQESVDVTKNRKRHRIKEIKKLDSRTLRRLRESVTRRTIRELSDLIVKHPEGEMEGGGLIYYHRSRLRFAYAENLNAYSLDRLSKIDSSSPTTITYLTSLADGYSNGGNCSMTSEDAGWKAKQDLARAAITEARLNPAKLPEAVAILQEDLRRRYIAGTPVSAPAGANYLGTLHTHDNSTDFSLTDLCLSRSSVRFLVSHMYPSSRWFDFRVALGGTSALVGNYRIRPSN